MLRSRKTGICFICVLLGLFSSLVTAATRPMGERWGYGLRSERPWGNFEMGIPGGRFLGGQPFVFSFSTNPAPRARHLTPTMPNPGHLFPRPEARTPMSRWGSGNGYQNSPSSSFDFARPQVEVEIADDTPYVQQQVLYTMRIISSGNVQSLEEPRLSSPDGGLVIEKLGDAQTHERHYQGSQRFVTEYRYTLTPLRAGRIALPSLKINGVMRRDARRGSGGQTFELTPQHSDDFKVLPPHGSVKSWLPLQALQVESETSAWRTETAGEPLTLTVLQSAQGISGDRLPSLLEHLERNDYKLYQEDVQVNTRVEPEELTLYGTRVERYTLVPQHGGSVRIPEVRVPWWNVSSHQQEWATMAGRALVVAGSSEWRRESEITSGPDRHEAFALGYWGPMLTVFGIVGIFWLGVWSRSRGITTRAREELVASLKPVWDHSLGRLWINRERFLPMFYVRRLRHRVMLALPVPFKIWYCLREIDCEQDPTEWCQMFQFVASRQLGLPPNTPMHAIAEEMARTKASSRGVELQRLLRELQDTLYGSKSLDFHAWKRAFHRVARPRLISLPWKNSRSQGSTVVASPALPELNPVPSK